MDTKTLKQEVLDIKYLQEAITELTDLALEKIYKMERSILESREEFNNIKEKIISLKESIKAMKVKNGTQ